VDCAVDDVKWIKLRGPVLTNYCADYLAVVERLFCETGRHPTGYCRCREPL